MEEQTYSRVVQDPEPERYYDWILWKIRQDDIRKGSMTIEETREETWKRTVADMQGEIHALQMTVVRLQEELTKLQKEKLDADI